MQAQQGTVTITKDNDGKDPNSDIASQLSNTQLTQLIIHIEAQPLLLLHSVLKGYPSTIFTN